MDTVRAALAGGTDTTFFNDTGKNKTGMLSVISAKKDVELLNVGIMQTMQQQPKGSSSSRRPKKDDSRLRQELVSLLDKFFEGTSYSLVFGRNKEGRLDAMVVYVDFLSEHLVGKMLADAIPKEVHVALKREYSDKAVAKVLLDEYRRNRVAVVDCYNGELRPQTIRDFVGRALERQEIL